MLEFEGHPRSSLVLLPGIIDQPQTTLSQIVATPRWRWLLPAILCLLGIALSVIVTAPYLSQQARDQQAATMQQIESQMGDMTESQRAEMQQQLATFTSPAVVGGVSLATQVLGLFVGWLLSSAFLYFSLQIIGRDLRFGQIFAGFSWTWLPFFLQDLVNSGWVLVTGQNITNPGLSYFVASGDLMQDSRNPAWILTGALDLFLLWHFVLVYFLIRATSRRGGGLALAIVFALLSLAFRVVPPILLSSFSPGG